MHDSPDLTLTPIGVIESPHVNRHDAPRQPATARGVPGCIQLHAQSGFEHALSDVAGWSHLWVIFWFHLNRGFRPKVAPPRSATKKGLFATRSPYRPNPLGLSLLRLERIEGLRLYVRDVDLLDGTPVLDIKPYVAYTDAPGELTPADPVGAGSTTSDGWLTAATTPDPGPNYRVHFTPRAEAALAWLAEQGVEWLRGRAEQSLALGPTPHPYRRIKPDGDMLRIAIRDFRLRFTVDDTTITVHSVHSGYKRKALDRPHPKAGADTPLAVHRAFLERFG